MKEYSLLDVSVKGTRAVISFTEPVTKKNFSNYKTELLDILEEDIEFPIVKLDHGESLTPHCLKLLISFQISVEKENLVSGLILDRKSQEFFDKIGISRIFASGDSEESVFEKMKDF